MGESRRSLTAIGLALAPILLVFVQPDLGTALVYGPRSAPCCSSPAPAGRTSRSSGSSSPCSRRRSCSGCCPQRASHVLKPYQRDRLTGFLAPDEDPSGSTYNITQSITAVGSGGVDGRGVARRDADEPQLPARARHRLRVRLARRAARLRRRRGPAAALPARRLARAEGHGRRARRVLGDRRGRDRLRVPLPDLRQRRHDDRDRADHRHPAAVRQRRRLVDDREPARDRRPAGDPRARPRARPADRAGEDEEALRSGRRPSSAILKELPVGAGGPAARRRRRARARAGARRASSRAAGSPRPSGAGAARASAAALVYVLAGEPARTTRRVLKEARARRACRSSRCRRPGVAASHVPYVLDETSSASAAAPASPSRRSPGALARAARRGGRPRSPPGCRCSGGPSCDELIRKFSRQNALIGAAVFVPGADMPVLTLNQVRLVLRIADAHGFEIDSERAARAARRGRSGLRLPRARRAGARARPGRGLGGEGRRSPTPARAPSARRRCATSSAARRSTRVAAHASSTLSGDGAGLAERVVPRVRLVRPART